jgi:hypothetical protein
MADSLLTERMRQLKTKAERHLSASCFSIGCIAALFAGLFLLLASLRLAGFGTC